MKLVVLFGVLVCVVSLGMGDEAQPAQHGSVSLLDISSYLIEEMDRLKGIIAGLIKGAILLSSLSKCLSS